MAWISLGDSIYTLGSSSLTLISPLIFTMRPSSWRVYYWRFYIIPLGTTLAHMWRHPYLIHYLIHATSTPIPFILAHTCGSYQSIGLAHLLLWIDVGLLTTWSPHFMRSGLFFIILLLGGDILYTWHLDISILFDSLSKVVGLPRVLFYVYLTQFL